VRSWLRAMHARIASPDDAAAIARIYNQGIADGTATFETRPRTESDILSWFDGAHPVIAVEEGGQVVAFGATFQYRPRACYAGIAETSVYVDRAFRGQGAGRLALEALIDAAASAGFWKLLSRIFVENAASRRLVASAGFREVGIYEKHGKLNGIWRDGVIVERLLPAAKY
jgi:L-amino acid N-acyltransferase YncA